MQNLFGLIFQQFREENVPKPDITDKSKLETMWGVKIEEHKIDDQYIDNMKNMRDMYTRAIMNKGKVLGHSYTYKQGEFDVYLYFTEGMKIPERVQLSRTIKGRKIYHEFHSGNLECTIVGTEYGFGDNRIEPNGKLRHYAKQDEKFLRDLYKQMTSQG